MPENIKYEPFHMIVEHVVKEVESAEALEALGSLIAKARVPTNHRRIFEAFFGRAFALGGPENLSTAWDVAVSLIEQHLEEQEESS